MTNVELPQRQKEIVSQHVTAMFARNPSFRTFTAAERAGIIRDTAAVVEAMVPTKLRRGPAARALEQAPPPADRWRPDERFQAEAISMGVTQVGRMINEVNFPAFVASLLKGTFQAIVDASIQQMKAYGELVQSVAMSLNDFRDQNVSSEQGAQHLVSKYPKHFQMGQSESGERRAQARRAGRPRSRGVAARFPRGRRERRPRSRLARAERSTRSARPQHRRMHLRRWTPAPESDWEADPGRTPAARIRGRAR